MIKYWGKKISKGKYKIHKTHVNIKSVKEYINKTHESRYQIKNISTTLIAQNDKIEHTKQ